MIGMVDGNKMKGENRIVIELFQFQSLHIFILIGQSLVKINRQYVHSYKGVHILALGRKKTYIGVARPNRRD